MTRTPSVMHDPELLEAALEGAHSIKEVLSRLGLRAAGGNYKAIHLAAEQYALELPLHDKSAAIALIPKEPVPDDQVFVENSTYVNRRMIKKRMLASGIPEECAECNLGPIWQGKPLTLQLEHKNGVWNDNRRENLCLLCPNCHSQTETYAGRSRQVNHSSAPKRSGRGAQREYPELNSLVQSVRDEGFSKAARSIGVSDTGLRKHLLKHLDPTDLIFHKKPRQRRN